MVRDGGRMVVCGHYTDNGSVEIHPHWQINRKHVDLKGVGARATIISIERWRSPRGWRRETMAGYGKWPLSVSECGRRFNGGGKANGDQGVDYPESEIDRDVNDRRRNC